MNDFEKGFREELQKIGKDSLVTIYPKKKGFSPDQLKNEYQLLEQKDQQLSDRYDAKLKALEDEYEKIKLSPRIFFKSFVHPGIYAQLETDYYKKQRALEAAGDRASDKLWRRYGYAQAPHTELDPKLF